MRWDANDCLVSINQKPTVVCKNWKGMNKDQLLNKTIKPQVKRRKQRRKKKMDRAEPQKNQKINHKKEIST